MKDERWRWNTHNKYSRAAILHAICCFSIILLSLPIISCDALKSFLPKHKQGITIHTHNHALTQSPLPYIDGKPDEILCSLPEASFSVTQPEREKERERHSHRHSITHARSHTAHVTGLQWPWIFQTARLSFPSIRNNAALTHRCTHTHTNTHLHTLLHAYSPSSAKMNTFTHLLTIQQWERQGEGDEEGVRAMERVQTQDERGKESIGAAMRQSTRTPPPFSHSL